jgi:hypothetical protein
MLSFIARDLEQRASYPQGARLRNRAPGPERELRVLIRAGVGYMAPQLHTVVQNARDFDHSIAYHPVQEQVAPASPVPSHVQRIGSSQDFIA